MAFEGGDRTFPWHTCRAELSNSAARALTPRARHRLRGAVCVQSYRFSFPVRMDGTTPFRLATRPSWDW